jgi:hypothetical protein
MSNTADEMLAGMPVTMAGVGVDGAHAEMGFRDIPSGPTTLIESPSDSMSLLVTPEGWFPLTSFELLKG